MKLFAITGTLHGSLIFANSEGEARRAFHCVWHGESILYCVQKPLNFY
jgi:hypothetical protein